MRPGLALPVLLRLRLPLWLLLLLSTHVTTADSDLGGGRVATGVDERQFLDNLDGMSPKELKKFVRANGTPAHPVALPRARSINADDCLPG